MASLVLRPDPVGLCLLALIDQTRRALAGDLASLAKLETSVRRADMGDPATDGPCFNVAEAASNLAWFQARDLPRFTQPEPLGVSQTHYRVDLSGTPPMVGAEAQVWLDRWQEPQNVMHNQNSFKLPRDTESE